MAWRRFRSAVEADEEVPGVTNLVPMAAGGNSTVYRALQPELNRWVAVKIPDFTLANDPARARFLRECSVVGRLTGHPNIVTVLGSGVTRSDRPFLTMDLFERSLAEVIAEPSPVPVALVLHHGVKLSGALETAHRAEILHRDLKPENVLLSRFGEPVLADFGIATLGEARGATEAFTASHAAPEVLDGQPATAAADVYGLGSTLWTAMAGRLPFGDGSEGPVRLMRRVLEEPLPPLGRDDVPPAVEEALRWAMAKRPEERPCSAEAFGQRLCVLQADLGLAVSELVVPDDLDRLGPPCQADTSLTPGPVRPPAPPAARSPAKKYRPWPLAGPFIPVGAPPTRARADVADGRPDPPASARSRRERRSDRQNEARLGIAGGAPLELAPAPGAPPALPGPRATIERRRAFPAPPESGLQPSRRPAKWAMAVVAAALVLVLASGAVIAARELRRPSSSPSTSAAQAAQSAQATSDTTATPGAPAAPGALDTPATPEGPATSATPAAPAAPGALDTPANPGAPATSETSAAPGAPATPDASVTPGRPAAPVPTAPTAPPPPGAGGPAASRVPTDVAVRTARTARTAREIVTVTWSPPSDRLGLLGYVVVHTLNGGEPTRRPVNDPDAVEASAELAIAGSRCFFVQAMYKDGQLGTSAEVCT